MNARIIPGLLTAAIVLVLAMQIRSLYIFPQPDGVRWWGDETGQILELRTELTGGYARIPTGLGSSVAVTNGIVRGNSWLAAALYGLPALLLSPAFDLVSVGRTVTIILALVLCIVTKRMLNAFGFSTRRSLFAVLLLVASRSYFFASHAARLDIATGLCVLGYTWFLSTRFERWHREEWHPTSGWWYLYGLVTMLFATLSIHLLTLLGVLSCYAIVRFGLIRKPRALTFAIGGVASSIVLLMLIYATSGAPWTLFGTSVSSNQFQSVANMLPVIRPFSRSVQMANILERVHGLWLEAPSVLLLGVIVLPTWVMSRRAFTVREQFLLRATVTILVSWLLFQSPALYYYMHVLPLFIVAGVIVLFRRLAESWATNTVLLCAALGITALNVRDAISAKTVARSIQMDNSKALDGALHVMTSSAHHTPIVLAQNPAIDYLEQRQNVRLMTAHIVSFDVSNKPLAASLDSIGVDYVLLYAPGNRAVYSLDYALLRPLADSIGTVVYSATGELFDEGRDYFLQPSTMLNPDTLLLYRLPHAR